MLTGTIVTIAFFMICFIWLGLFFFMDNRYIDGWDFFKCVCVLTVVIITWSSIASYQDTGEKTKVELYDRVFDGEIWERTWNEDSIEYTISESGFWKIKWGSSDGHGFGTPGAPMIVTHNLTSEDIPFKSRQIWDLSEDIDYIEIKWDDLTEKKAF